MEADWEFEVGGQAPVIEAHWPGFVDLRAFPERAGELLEARQLPGLAAALEALNSAASPVWTSKCGYMPRLEPQEFDADELDAPTGCAAHATSCYIDVLPRSERVWLTVPQVEEACRGLCAVLRAVPIRACRVDLVARLAVIESDRADLGMTAYVTACGSTQKDAESVLAAALSVFARSFCGSSKLQ